ncbi:MAG: hypothetical protein HY784_04970 [Chloroflexi bacterium]|nr:hypothetical protein [Chloroflexota bacterium]
MSVESDQALLRRFEPVIRYTRGEKFFPIEVEPYVRQCSLWVQRPDEEARRLAPEGELTLEKLTAPRADGFGAIYFLKFIEPLNIAALAAYRLQESLKKKDPKDVFHAGRGRLARVGYGSRFVDALFSISLLARGRVPGDTAAAAALTCQRMLAENEHYCYYGRVTRSGQNGWVALQYWFFYPFNNWRSGFFGVNDHEADWEMIYLYLSESETGEVTPEWAAYASHDFSGDDLRRRWDDPELEKVGEHPVIYAGAGSHASYYSRGEYLAEVELPFLSPLVRLVDKVQEAGRKILGQVQGEQAHTGSGPEFNVFRIPFVDYARGDGVSLGPGQDKEWSEPGLLDPAPEWALHYRGLWGLYARDPISGENAPAGPVYNRDGTMRRSWYDPLGWAGLDKIPPPDEAADRVQHRRTEIEARRAELAQSIADKSHALIDLGVEAAAMQGRPHLKKLHTAHEQKIAALSKEVNQLRAQLASDDALLEALDLHAAQLHAGDRGPARAHIHRAHTPASDAGLQLNRFAEMWAAISIGLMMVGFVMLVLFARHYLIFGLVALISLITFVEAGFRQQLPRLITSVTFGLAIVSALVLLFEFFWQIVVLAVLVAGGYIMWENLRELRG